MSSVVTAETIGGETAHGLLEYRVGEDPGLKSFMEQGGSFELDDLLGTWEMIEAEALPARAGSCPTACWSSTPAIRRNRR
jgi:hypothetical protein